MADGGLSSPSGASLGRRRSNAFTVEQTAVELSHIEDTLINGIIAHAQKRPHALPQACMELILGWETKFGSAIVKDFLCLMVSARDGLSEPELRVLLHLSPVKWTAFRNAVKPFLVAGGGSGDNVRFTLDAPAMVAGRPTPQEDAISDNDSVSGVSSFNPNKGMASVFPKTNFALAMKLTKLAAKQARKRAPNTRRWPIIVDNVHAYYHMELAIFFAARSAGFSLADASFDVLTGSAALPLPAHTTYKPSAQASELHPMWQRLLAYVQQVREVGVYYQLRIRRAAEALRSLLSRHMDREDGSLVSAENAAVKKVGRWVSHGEESVSSGLRYTGFHLVQAGRTHELMAVLMDLHFTEAMAASGYLFEEMDILAQLQKMLTQRIDRLIADKAKLHAAPGTPSGGGGGFSFMRLLKSSAFEELTINHKIERSDEHRRKVGEMLDFLRAQIGTLVKYPFLAFQIAASQPDGSLLSTLCKDQWQTGHEARPYLEWLTKPQSRNPCLMVLNAPGDESVMSLSYSHDGTMLVGIMEDGGVVLWEVSNGAVLQNLAAPVYESSAARGAAIPTVAAAREPITSTERFHRRLDTSVVKGTYVVFHPEDRNYFLSGDSAGHLYQWDMRGQQCRELLATDDTGVLGPVHTGAITHAAWHSDGVRLLVGDANGFASIWEFGARAWELSVSKYRPIRLHTWQAHAGAVKQVAFGHADWRPEMEIIASRDTDRRQYMSATKGHGLSTTATTGTFGANTAAATLPPVAHQGVGLTLTVRQPRFEGASSPSSRPQRPDPAPRVRPPTASQLALQKWGQSLTDVRVSSVVMGNHVHKLFKQGSLDALNVNVPPRLHEKTRDLFTPPEVTGTVRRSLMRTSASLPALGVTGGSRAVSPQTDDSWEEETDHVHFMPAAGGPDPMQQSTPPASAWATLVLAQSEPNQLGALLPGEYLVITGGEHDGSVWKVSGTASVAKVGQLAGTILAATSDAARSTLLTRSTAMLAKIISSDGVRVNLQETEGGAITHASVSSRDRIAVCNKADHTLRVYLRQTGKKVGVLRGHLVEMSACTYAPDGLSIATADMSGVIRIWMPQLLPRKQQGFRHPAPVTHAAFFPCAAGSQIMTGSSDGNVKFWLTSQARVHAEEEVGSSLLGLRFIRHGTKWRGMAIGQGAVRGWEAMLDAPGALPDRPIPDVSNVRIWALNNAGDMFAYVTVDGVDGVQVVFNGTGKLWCNFATAEATSATVLTFSPDDRLLLVGLNSGHVLVFDLASPRHRISSAAAARNAADAPPDPHAKVDRVPIADLFEFDSSSIRKLIFSPSGTRLLWIPVGSPVVKVWDFAKAVETSGDHDVRKFYSANAIHVLRGHLAAVYGVHAGAWLPNEKAIVTVGDDGTMRFWDCLTYEQYRKVFAHEGAPILDVKVAATGDRIVTSGKDRTLRLFDGSGNQMAIWLVAPPGTVSSFAIDPTGEHIIVGDQLGSVSLLEVRGLPAIGVSADGSLPILTMARPYFCDKRMWHSQFMLRCVNCGLEFPAFLNLVELVRDVQARILMEGPKPQLLHDPRFVMRCTRCKYMHRVNPFILDNPLGLK